MRRLCDGLTPLSTRRPQALQHLEMQLINVACDDPGASIGANMALPLLQERLDACARKYAEEKALEAQEALFHTEVCPVMLGSKTKALTSEPHCNCNVG